MSSIGTQEMKCAAARLQPAPWAELIGRREAAAVAAPWRSLAGDLVEENPFYEPWTLLPALEHYGDDQVRLACVWDGPARTALLGLAPVAAQRGYARLAIDYWTVWTHPHCYFAAPLIRRSHERRVAEALLTLLCDGAGGRRFFQLRRIDPDGAIVRAFHDVAADARHCYVADSHARAALLAGPAPAAYLESALRKKKRKELSRLRRRLEERGAVRFFRLDDAAQHSAWTEAFLALEDKGWKGAGGTSLKSSPADAAWFRDSLAGAFAAGKLEFLRLDCGGRPIAMLANFVVGGAGYSLKIAHDPEFARYSPGVMIEIEATRRLLADPAFTFMDSCAAPDHPMINSLWKGRRRIASVNVSGTGAADKAALRLCHALETTRGALAKAQAVSGIKSRS